MRIEIESAANFLSNLLRLHPDCLSPDQLDQFRQSVIDHLVNHYQLHWFPDRPFKGSGYRCLRINHKMDPVIAKAGRMCGIDDSSLRSYFPEELTLWIDPNEVSYRIGENGSICVLYDADDPCLNNNNNNHYHYYQSSNLIGQTSVFITNNIQDNQYKHSLTTKSIPCPPPRSIPSPISSSGSLSSQTSISSISSLSSPSSSPDKQQGFLKEIF